MARGSKRRSTRNDPSLSDGERPVQLQESRRFFSSGGSDSANRQANALKSAFGVGTEMAKDLFERQNVKGAQQAKGEIATGGTQDEENKNKGYMEMWQTLEAENDKALFATELDEILRGADYENRTEAEVQQLVDTYYSKQLKGINPNSVYGELMAEGIMEQNAEILVSHRDMQIANIKSEQAAMIHENAGNVYEATGKYPSAQVAEQIGMAYDGPERMTAWINELQASAVEHEDEDIINDAITHFKNGDPSGINDPKYAMQLELAKGKARAAKARTEEKLRAEAAARKEAQRNAGNMSLLVLIMDDVDPAAAAMELGLAGVIEPADVKAATAAYRTSRDDRAQHGSNTERVARIQTQIMMDPNSPLVSYQALLNEWGVGTFGPPESPEAKTALRTAMKDVTASIDRKERITADPRMSILVGRFNESFPVPKDMYGVPVAGVMTELRAEYSAEFEIALLSAAPEDYRNVYENYSKLYSEARSMEEAKQSSTTPSGVHRQLVLGNFTATQAAAMARSNGWSAQYMMDTRAAGEWGPDTKTFEAGSKQDQAYIALLQELRKDL